MDVKRYKFVEDYNLRMPRLSPGAPEGLVLAERAEGGEGWPPEGTRIVGPGSTLKDRKAASVLAGRFSFEMETDGRMYCPLEDKDNPDVRVLLLEGEIPPFAYGAVCFRYRRGHRFQFWGLQWVWIHPFERDKKRFSSLWPALEKRFGPLFVVEPPYSRAMATFRDKIGYRTRLETWVHGPQSRREN